MDVAQTEREKRAKEKAALTERKLAASKKWADE